MRFTKMEGLGNDYVYVNGFEEAIVDPVATARAVSDRHFGIGSDGLIQILPSEVADIRMEMWNADGSRSEMCGNGLRCVGFYAYRYGIVADREMTVETGAGVLTVTVLEETDRFSARVRMAMGKPRLERAEIPMRGPAGRVLDEAFEVAGEPVRLTSVSMGNPHAVIFVPDAKAAPVTTLGPAIEHDPRFPNRVNVEFVQVVSEAELIQRTWERGTGETMACGTGAAAVAVASILTGRGHSPLTIHLLGGDLELAWDGKGPVVQTGPARIVFTGRWEG